MKMDYRFKTLKSTIFQKHQLKSFLLFCLFCFTLFSIYAFQFKIEEKRHFYKEVPSGYKFILLWTPADYFPFFTYGQGNEGFKKHKCAYTNCYVTSDRYFFGNDIRRFDAIAFNGRNIEKYTKRSLPYYRYTHQKYIYVNTESADNYPVCNILYNNYFNWTSTYKLNSDIPFPYIEIRDNIGVKVGPKVNMDWIIEEEITEDVFSKYPTRKKAVAWFISNCKTRSKRLEYFKDLNNTLSLYGLAVDVYGSCGELKCPKGNDCDKILRDNYYFYLAFENTFSEDYVTEKLLRAVQNDVIPIVYGGANYSRFLPNGSFLNAREYPPIDMAQLIYDLMHSSRDYNSFFKWKRHYNYHDALGHSICDICAALNDDVKMKTKTVYRNFKYWWNEDYIRRCKWGVE